MPHMESGQDCRGGYLYSQIHGHHSEKSSGAKTPKTPSLREAIPNYNEIHASGRSSREKTPSARNVTGEKTPNIYEHQLVASSGRSSIEKTPREFDHLKEGTHIAESRRSSHKRERSNERRRIHDDDEEDERHMYNEKQIVVAHHRNRHSIESSTRQQDNERAASSASRKNHASKSAIFRRQRKQGRIMYDEASEEEDSACSMFKGEWNSSPPGLKTDIISSSQVSVVQKFVQAQAQALAKYSHDSKENYNHDEWDSDLKKPQPTKNLAHQKAIAAVLAFQRWRHTQLKKLFSMELKNVLEEAKEDEACLAQLEKELATKNKHLAQLREQVAQYERESHEQVIQRQMHELLGANVQELEKECQKALERASQAEDVLRKRDAENVRLRERLRSLDEEGVRLDSELQTNLKLLQNEKESALDEGRVLLTQLTRRDEEVTQQCKEIEKLRATLAQISDRQISQQKQVDDMTVEHHAHVQGLQDKLQKAFAANHAQEMELASYTERCNGLGQERQNLLVQLHHAVERADLASRRAEELQMKLHYTTEERAKASEDVATEMVEHLKRLTGHMKELETSVDQNGIICLQPGALQKKAGLAKISTKLAQAELDTLNLISQSENCEDDQGRRVPFPEVEENKRQAYFSLEKKNRRRAERSLSAITSYRKDAVDPCNMSVIDRDIALTKLKNWIAWKWRWAAAAARADNLLKQLQNQQMTQEAKFFRESEGGIVQREGSPLRGQKLGLVKRLESSQFGNLSILDGDGIGAFILKHKLVPLMMSAWRAFARMSSLERKAATQNQSLNKIMAALPWWIRRVGERRLLERFFFHWQLLTLKATREKSNQNLKKKITPTVNPITQSGGRDQEGDPYQAQPQTQARAKTPNFRDTTPNSARDAEVQTTGTLSSRAMEPDGKCRSLTHGVVEEDRRYRSPNYKGVEVDGKPRASIPGAPEVEGRQRTPTPGTTPLRAPSTPRFAHRAKSEAKTIVQCPTCDIRKKHSSSLSSKGPQQLPNEKVDLKNGITNNSTFTARALRALQGSLQQELKELQYLLSQEMEDMQQIPVSSEDHEDGDAEYNRQALKSVFEVCNNLAQSLMEVRSQLNCAESQGGNTPRAPSPLPPSAAPRVLRTRYLDARDTSEGGGGRARGSSTFSSREKSSTIRQPNHNKSGETRTPCYASPIGREKGARFSSPGWRSQEKLSSREPWSSPGSPTRTAQLREREAKVHAPSTIRELRDLRARQDRQQHVYENNSGRSGRQSPLDRDDEIGDLEREPQQRQVIRRGENVVRFSGDTRKAVQARGGNYEEQAVSSSSKPGAPPPPDYTTVVQILNQENTKIGEVAIHTSAVTAADRTSERGGIADLCSSARDAIRAEEQNNKTLQQHQQLETQRQHPEPPPVQQQQGPRTPEQLAEEEPIFKRPPPLPQPVFRPKCALKLPAARGQSTPRERGHRSHHVLRRPVDQKPRLDDTYFLSLRRKQCIGSDYADLLKSEIVRLREGRLMLEDCKTICQGEGDALQPSRDLTPRHQSSMYLANRPSWRPHYTAATASSKK